MNTSPAIKLLKICIAVSSLLFFSCKSGPANLFKTSSPHEQYQRKLIASGLDKTGMGSAWIVSAYQSLQKALTITIPYRETGYFAAESVPAAAYRFEVIQGQKISIHLSKKPETLFMIYMDVWEQPKNGPLKLIASADTTGSTLSLDPKTTGTLLIRLQPELLRGGQYTLEITTGPSLGFPVKSSNSSHIQSIFGDGRDKNSRKHEGIDIFAPSRTPVIASAEGTIIRVNENNLGGKVVWLRQRDKDYTLYYAHLDRQIASEGQTVSTGDTLGLVGNTGNARTTSPHLHFGVYTSGGAIDPYPFVNTVIRTPAAVNAPLDNLNKTMRTSTSSFVYSGPENNAGRLSSLKAGSIVRINAATSNWYKIELPDGKPGFMQSKALVGITRPLRKIRLKSSQQQLYDQPDALAAVKQELETGSTAELLGDYENFHLVKTQNNKTGWIRQE